MSLALRVATRSEQDRQKEEAERLVRPSPKQKPPRRDLRRERVDTDVEEDPDEKQDRKDRSQNYKDIGGSVLRVIRKWARATDRIPMKNRETDKVVWVTEETVKNDPGKYEEIEEIADEDVKDDPGEEEAPVEKKPQKKPSKEKKPGGGAVEKKLQELGLESGAIADILALIEGTAPFASKPAKPRKKRKDKGTKRAPKPKAPVEEEAPVEEKAPGKEEVPVEETKKEEVPQEKAQFPKAPSQRSVAEKKGIPEPERPEPTPEERTRAVKAITGTFPPGLAANFLAADLHPQDALTLSETYSAVASAPVRGNLGDYVAKIKENYQTDVDKVPLPKTWKKGKREVPFDELDEAERAEAYRQHQMETVALSLAAEPQIAESLKKSLGTLSGLAAQAMVRPGVNPESQARTAMDGIIQSGVPHNLSPKKARALMLNLPDEAKPIVAASLQANAYLDAKKQLLEDESSPFFISEDDSPEAIATSIMRAARQIRSSIGESDPDLGGSNRLQEKVMARLEELDPRKAKEVQQAIDKESAHLYDLEVKKFEREQKKWERQKKKHDQGQKARRDKAEKKWKSEQKKKKDKESEKMPIIDYRTPAKVPEEAKFEELEAEDFRPPPKPPVKPPRYDAIRGKGRARAEEVLRRFQAGDFIYPPDRTMARTAVYYGVEPPSVEPYPEWGQVGKFDLTPEDISLILAAARVQLKAPLHTEGTSGMSKDQWFRSALDLALKETGYIVDPLTYNQLLSKLTGAKDQSGGTVPGVVAGDSTFSPPSRGDKTMKKLSAEQSKAASTVLARMDQISEYLQKNYAGLGIDFDEAKKVVNALDMCADDFEKAVFGEESFEHRRQEVMASNKEAEVIQRDSDEPYMDAFNNPSGTKQTDSDEPYMSTYNTDQTTEVVEGEDAKGEDLTPNYDG